MKIYRNLCFGCGACRQTCPVNAITMDPDGQGALHPQIDEALCIACGLCEAVCPDRNPAPRFRPAEGYAAVCRNADLLENAASGGAFSALAKAVLEQGGSVFGSAYPEGTESFAPVHTPIDSPEDLWRLQGSKYAQSDTTEIYGQVKNRLEAGRTVLFSGTPCQVDGLYGFLRGKRYANLWTVDLICHGVPSGKLLDDYLRSLEKKSRISVQEFLFRGKYSRWGAFAYRLKYSRKGKHKEIQRPANRSSYYWLFLKGAIYRDNCYSCPYASLERTADLTLGDWWGIQQEYPEYVSGQPGTFSLETGISCVLVNTAHGRDAMERFGAYLETKPTAPDAAARWNHQLCHPQQIPAERQAFLDAYSRRGYEGVAQWYEKRNGIKGKLREIKDWMKDLRKPV